jgi:hypothetical protein
VIRTKDTPHTKTRTSTIWYSYTEAQALKQKKKLFVIEAAAEETQKQHKQLLFLALLMSAGQASGSRTGNHSVFQRCQREEYSLSLSLSCFLS